MIGINKISFDELVSNAEDTWIEQMKFIKDNDGLCPVCKKNKVEPECMRCVTCMKETERLIRYAGSKSKEEAFTNAMSAFLFGKKVR